ncbi:response regulator transcription factor [Geovibrio thiophilus]|uniref:Response regulator transcription factor n=1 Tax=Geovibrio thiophilus TaxID=139438 RepID=A0A410JWP3_9BACT|nr:response regulator transcription factor [Geovibrio thiophilus]QAR32584.1 response regulator transcription factor [Geovibrio thiophilus]
MRLLLIEDDSDLAENVIDYFEMQGWSVDYAITGEAGLQFAQENHYDALILDINLPGINGFEVCRLLRRKLRLNMPVIMLTARTMLNDKLDGFESGTDDYLPKPFELAELKVRLEAAVRRTKHSVAGVFEVGGLSLDPENGCVTRGGKIIDLPGVCFTILRKLMEAHPGIVSKEELEYAIWKDQPPQTNALKAHFYTLRQLVDKPFDKELLHTVRGRGYKIAEEVPEEPDAV